MLTSLYVILIVNKSLEKTKTNYVLVHLMILLDFPNLFAALSPKPIYFH